MRVTEVSAAIGGSGRRAGFSIVKSSCGGLRVSPWMRTLAMEPIHCPAAVLMALRLLGNSSPARKFFFT